MLVRLGFGAEHRDYARTYRLASEAAERDLEGAPPGQFVEAHQLLRQHGQVRCTRNRPACAGCPLAGRCATARAVRA